MSIHEADRHQLIRLLTDAITPEGAALLMEHLPPVGWADVATKRDLDALAAVTKRDLDALAAATKRDLDALAAATKRDLDAYAAATNQEIALVRVEATALRSELQARADVTDAKIDAVKYEVLATLRYEMAQHTRTLVLANVAGLLSAVGLAFAAAKLA